MRSKGVSDFPYRVDYGPGYRVYYLQRGNRVILLLCGGDKSSQQRDIETAKQIATTWSDDEQED